MKVIFLLKEILKSLKRKRVYQFLFLFLIMCISGLAEMVSVASILPFLRAIENQNINSNIYIKKKTTNNKFQITFAKKEFLN